MLLHLMILNVLVQLGSSMVFPGPCPITPPTQDIPPLLEELKIVEGKPLLGVRLTEVLSYLFITMINYSNQQYYYADFETHGLKFKILNETDYSVITVSDHIYVPNPDDPQFILLSSSVYGKPFPDDSICLNLPPIVEPIKVWFDLPLVIFWSCHDFPENGEHDQGLLVMEARSGHTRKMYKDI